MVGVEGCSGDQGSNHGGGGSRSVGSRNHTTSRSSGCGNIRSSSSRTTSSEDNPTMSSRMGLRGISSRVPMVTSTSRRSR